MDSVVELRFKIHEDGTLKSLTFSKNTSVKDVKSVVCKDCGLNEQGCELLFCGHVLGNDDHLSDYNLGQQTILHVVVQNDQEDSHPAHELSKNISTITTPYLTGIWLHRRCVQFPYFERFNSSHSKKPRPNFKQPQFHVYCKGNCNYVRPGKLRARCTMCKQGSIKLHRDPNGWMDVLRSAEILANCFSEQCQGSVCDVEFYFKCALCNSPPESAIPLPNVSSNSKDTLCSTCIDVETPVVEFPCNNDHVMCLTCFEEYAHTCLRERRMAFDENAGYSVPCPVGCSGAFLADTHILHILGADEYAMYQSFAAEECLLQGMRGIVCPSPNCGAGLYADLIQRFQDRTEIVCSECRFKFCSTCRQASHGSSSCIPQLPDATGRSDLVHSYLASIEVIEEISKKCPNCKVPTERNGGCLHMTCSRCKFEWCWNCLIEWNSSCQSDHWFGRPL